MKYRAVIETDGYEDFEFFEDGNGKYIHGIDAGSQNNEWIALYFTECEQESVLDKIRAEIEQAADKQFQIAMGVTDLNERYTHIQMENAYRHSLNIIDKYKAESNK